MEFTNEKLKDINKKRGNTLKYSIWLQEYNRDIIKRRDKEGNIRQIEIDYISRQHERMKECLNFWEWDLYRKNKVMDLVKVNRCMNRFCPNCRRVSLGKNLLEFIPVYSEFILQGYKPYLLTLSQPNVKGSDLKNEIFKINVAFKRFWKWIYGKIGKEGYNGRFFNSIGCIKFLEITFNKKSYTYHPHLHILLFTDNKEFEGNFKKNIKGEYSTKRGEYDLLSNADLQIRELWYKAFNNIRVNDKIDNYYICDIRPCDEKGVYEVFKYCFKDSDITSYNTFTTIYNAIYGKRIKQGYGKLYNLKVVDEEEQKEEKEDNINDYLLYDISENPDTLVTAFKNLTSKEYHDYKKISRFCVDKYSDDIID